MRAPTGSRHRVASWAASQASEHGGLAADRNGASVLLLPGDDPSALARRVGRELKASVGAAVTVGAGGPAYGPGRDRGGLPDGRAVRGRADRPRPARHQRRPGRPRLRRPAHGRRRRQHRRVRHGRTIGAVLDYDRRRGTVLGQTLESYFAAGGSPARAAELLHVHVNTVTQRLERLSTLARRGLATPRPRAGDPACPAPAPPARLARR